MKPPPSPQKTVKNIQGVLHGALRQAVINRYIPLNPADGDFCKLPKVKRQEIKPRDETQITAFLDAIHGNPFEDLFIVTLFTGLRQGEVLGLCWNCVDLENNVLTINKQMQLHQEQGMKAYQLVATKTVRPAPSPLPPL